MSALMEMHVVRLAALTTGAAMPLPIRAAFMIRLPSQSGTIILRVAMSDNADAD